MNGQNPVVLVSKIVSTQPWFCSYMRKFNSTSCFDSYPKSRTDLLLERLGKAKHIITLDLCKGYWQMPLDLACKEYTAFQIPGMGLFHYIVQPFGLNGAPATFQRLMDNVLNLLTLSQTCEEHPQHLEVVLGKICGWSLAD